jgi:hypothetical protein
MLLSHERGMQIFLIGTWLMALANRRAENPHASACLSQRTQFQPKWSFHGDQENPSVDIQERGRGRLRQGTQGRIPRGCPFIRWYSEDIEVRGHRRARGLYLHRRTRTVRGPDQDDPSPHRRGAIVQARQPARRGGSEGECCRSNRYGRVQPLPVRGGHKKARYELRRGSRDDRRWRKS